jgi:hypothetical protein
LKVRHAAKVAAVTTAALTIVYVLRVAMLNLTVSAHLAAQNDRRLGARSADLR